MTPEDRKLLEATYELANENNKILRSMRNSARLDKVFRYGYWIIIILISYFAYVAVQPYMGMMKSFTSSGSNLQYPNGVLRMLNELNQQ
jgi:hypothetical protein